MTTFVKNLLKSEDVDYIEEDGASQLESISQWGLGRIDQRNLPLDSNTPDYYTDNEGVGVTIYVLDTGIHLAHNDFTNRIVASEDIVTEDGDGEDCYGHGTHCAGIAAGTTFGVAPKASIVNIRAFNCQGQGLNSKFITGLEYIKDHKINNQISKAVASLSVGTAVGDTNLSGAVQTATESVVAAGVTVVVAAGNQKADACTRVPGISTKVITVAGSDSSDDKLTWSNWGSCVDIFAPGKSILSDGIDSTTDTETKSGTSMACPHVAGAAALILSARDITPAQVKAELIASSTKDKISLSSLSGSPNRLLYIGTADQCLPNCRSMEDNADRARSGDINMLHTDNGQREQAAFWEDFVARDGEGDFESTDSDSGEF